MREVILAKTAGFCFGVRRAVQIAEDAAAGCERCYTLGPIIHNRHVVDALAERGVYPIADLSEPEPGSTVIIRSHGAGKAELEALERADVRVVDATCPNVEKIHRIVAEAERRGRIPVIIGEKAHPEVRAICGWCTAPIVLETADELAEWLRQSPAYLEKPLTVVFQTTGAHENVVRSVNFLKKECTSAEIFDTICNATTKRQEEAARLAAQCDAMIVIGGKESANSKRLADICGQACSKVFFVEAADALPIDAFDGDMKVGIIAGASTPAWIIKEVYHKMIEEKKQQTDEITALDLEAVPAEEASPVADEIAAPVQVEAVSSEAEDMAAPAQEEAAEAVAPQASVDAPEPAQEESFAEMLEKSIKTLHTGEKVTGVVAAITPTEISVDLGTKQSGYIPISELTDDPDAAIEDLVQVGGEVDAYVMRVNDVEGTVMLSKKRLDTVKNWDEIEAARVEKRTVEGLITEENKGGVVARVKGVRVFIPASQTGLPKDTPMSALVRQRVKLRITEVNQSRRRVVGSIRVVRAEERKELAQKTWEDIEVGKRYDGVVKSLTSYGAFVDIGGVDGMVHVSELSWGRIKNPADVLHVGQEISVYVLRFDKEKGKISLGYKDPNANPWKIFTENYKVGTVSKVKVVKLMPFGAFAEIVPGVDGLIHISQIADHRIGRPDEFLSEGQEVDAMIVDIDYDKKNISLSIRALTDESAAPAEVDQPDMDSDGVVYDTDVNMPEDAEDIE